jgi:hypothetical protein
MSQKTERRKTKRLSVNMKAERLSCVKNCSVFIENLSERGIHMITAPAKNPGVFEAGSPVELKFRIGNGQTIKLQCNVKWAYDNSKEDMTSSVGLEIIDPPVEYREFVRSLR